MADQPTDHTTDHVTDTGTDPGARLALLQMIFGFFPAKAVNVAAELGLADHVAAGPRRIDDLASTTGCDAGSLRRLLRALAFLGVLSEPEPGLFGLGPLGGPLRTTASGSVRSLSLLFGGDMVWRSWGDLAASVRTGDIAFDDVFGMSAFEYMAANPDVAEMFNQAMSEGTRMVTPGIVDAYDFAQFTTVADLGGNDGTLLAAVLAANPGLHGILFDVPAGSREAKRVLEAAGVQDRCELVVGDFFEAVPRGVDCFMLKSVIHDWDDHRSGSILANCRRAIDAEGRLLIVEGILPPRAEQIPALSGLVMSDLNMLVCAGGRERTEDDFRSLLADSGFELIRVTPIEGPTNYCIIESVPV